MPTFTYPTNAELQVIAQDKLPALTMDDPIFQIMPVRERDTSLVMWEQRDNYIGLQQVRGMNGAPPNVKQVGAKRYQMQPGVYGEFIPIDELSLTERRRWGTFNEPVSIDDLVMENQDQLLSRQIDRMRQVGWTLLSTGAFSVPGPNGAILHTDTFPLQTFAAAVTWATVGTATPLADLGAVQLLGAGRGVNFGQGARAYMNRVTFNSFRNNTNPNDFGGRRGSGMEGINGLGRINELLTGDDLPNIVIYDEGYINDAGTFVRFIGNNKVVVVGQRAAGQTIGEMQMTRNANNDNLEPGAYSKVVDNGERAVPRVIEVHAGFNGGPALYYPGSIVLMTV